MGISLAWVAVEALSNEEALRRLALSRSGKSCEYPTKGVSGHPLPRGWYLAAATRCDHRIVGAASMVAVSQGCRAVACSVEEHVNYASCELWENGTQLWHVEHQGDRDVESLSYKGALPARFHDLLATVEPGNSENLSGHFHMDIPLLLAKDITGFQHDECNFELDSTPFEELIDLFPKRKWLRLWR